MQAALSALGFVPVWAHTPTEVEGKTTGEGVLYQQESADSSLQNGRKDSQVLSDTGRRQSTNLITKRHIT